MGIKTRYIKKTTQTKTNWYARIKKLHSSYTRTPTRLRYYFDTETFEYYETPEQELPKIVPYLIGMCRETAESYKYFLGINSANEFLTYIFTQCDLSYSELHAYNLDYDFQTIRPYLEEHWLDDIDISYMMTSNKRFIVGDLVSNTVKDKETFLKENPTRKTANINCKLIDLWMWDKTKGLRQYIKRIRELIWNKYTGELSNTETSTILYQKLCDMGLTKETFNKTEIDYKKVNLHQIGDDYYYWPSKQSWINNEQPIKLDLDNELDYLKRDVITLPVIRADIIQFKLSIRRLLDAEKCLDSDHSITLPGFGKYIFEEWSKEYMTQNYRSATDESDYVQQDFSYSGAFTASNKHITYLDEKVFKEMYPGKSFYDSNNNPIIKTYDINSLYPSVMRGGLPTRSAILLDDEDKESMKYLSKMPHVIWYEIKFNGEIEPGIYYKWKKKYDCFNNSFFGDGMLNSYLKNSTIRYVLKPLYDLFVQMCDSNIEIVNTRYQNLTTMMDNFIDVLYKVKRNDKVEKIELDGSKTLVKPYTDDQVANVKLLLNSLYGKLGEKFKKEKYLWTSNAELMMRKWYPNLSPDSIEFKRKIPHLNKDKNCAFYASINTAKTTNEEGDNVRESILAGLYVTQKSRWTLLSTIKNEIDQGNVLLNCDTDSIKMIQFNSPKFKVHTADLGAWKPEGHYTHFMHPNKLKKYCLINTRLDNDKDNVCIKCAGLPQDIIYKEGEETLDELIAKMKIIYDPNNRVIIKEAKTISKRNEDWQIVILDVDFKFLHFDDKKLERTHTVENRKVIAHE